MRRPRDRRDFLRRALAVGAVVSAPGACAGRLEAATQASPIGALDHVAVPMRDVDAMIGFYRGLGFGVREGTQIVSVHVAEQKINFHRPELWQGGTFELRAPAAQPPCGDFCFVWTGTAEALVRTLEGVGAEIVAQGSRQGGSGGGDAVGESVYVRDPDGNLLEFIRYP